jgi:L-ascorbate metabolism protein UlaG (beta-lactamase superfamily)
MVNRRRRLVIGGLLASALLPISSNRDPQDSVHMVRFLRTENPNLKTVVPHHHRLQPPPGAATPAAMEQALKAAGLPVTVLSPDLSKVYELTR